MSFFTNWPSKMTGYAITKNSKNIKQVISYEQQNGLCQNIDTFYLSFKTVTMVFGKWLSQLYSSAL